MGWDPIAGYLVGKCKVPIPGINGGNSHVISPESIGM